jgi:AsmA protein
MDSLSVFPRVRAVVDSAALSDVPGSGRPPMLELGRTEFEMALWPLLSGTVDVRRLTTDALRANLLVDPDGRPNWEFRRQGDDQGADSPQPAPQEPTRLPDIRLGEARLDGVGMAYKDERTGQAVRLSDGALVVAMPNLDTPARVDGRATVNDRGLVLKATVASPRALAEQRPTTLQGQITSDLFTAKLEAGPEAEGRTGGPLSVSVPDLHAVAAWLGMPNAQSLPLRSVSLIGKATLGGQQADLSGFKLALDELKAEGNLEVDWSARVPAMSLQASVDPVNLDRFLPQVAPNGTPPAAPPTNAPSTGWSDEPVDLTALRTVNLDAVIESRGLQLRKIQLGPSRTTVRLRDGVLAIDAPDVPVSGGRTSTALRIDASRQPAGLALKASSDGIQAEQLLAALAGTDIVRGAAFLDVDVTAAGNSQRALVSALDGTARVVFRDGALRGINIAAILRDPLAAATGRQQNVARETDFAEFGGNFRLERGVARTADLRMLAPLFRVEGEGAVSLPDQRLDLRLNPTAAATLKGQGGPFDHTGVTIPVLVTGPFSAPSIQPDFTGVASSVIQDPAKAADAVKRLREGASSADILGGLAGSGSSGKPPSADGGSDAPSAAGPLGDALKGAPLPLQKGPLEEGIKGLFGR